MLLFLADENLDLRIVRGLQRRVGEIDLVRAQQVGLSGKDDPSVLEWAASQGRIVLTHDVATMTRYAYDRLRTHKPMPGIVEINKNLSIGIAVEDLALLATAGLSADLEGQILYLPL